MPIGYSNDDDANIIQGNRDYLRINRLYVIKILYVGISLVSFLLLHEKPFIETEYSNPQTIIGDGAERLEIRSAAAYLRPSMRSDVALL